MRQSRKLWILTGVLSAYIILFNLSNAVAQLTPDQESRLMELGKKGKNAYDSGDFQKAVIHLTEASKIFKDPNIMLYIGHCHRNLDQYRQSVAAYKDYLELLPEASDRGKVEQYIVRMEEKIIELQPELSISTEPSEGTFYLDSLDEEPKGITPVVLRVTEGPHTLYVAKEGYETYKTEIDVREGEKLAFHWELRADLSVDPDKDKNSEITPNPDGPKDGEKKPDKSKDDGPNIRAITGWSLAGAGALGLIVGVLAHRSSNSFKEDAEALWDTRQDNDRSEYDSVYAEAVEARKGAIFFYIAGGALFTTGVVLLVIDLLDDKVVPVENGVTVVPLMGSDFIGSGIVFSF